jgi:hypothetical protein
MTAEPWISVGDVANLAPANDSGHGWIDTRHLPAHKVGRLWKFRRLSKVDEWIQSEGTAEDSTRRER